MCHPSLISTAACRPLHLIRLSRARAVDYILFLQKNVEFKAEPNEVQDTKWVTPDELRQLIASAEDKGLKITPWFKLIVDK